MVIEDAVLLRQCLFLGPTALPAVTPVADEEVEAKGVDAETGFEADDEVIVVHAVLVHVGVEET